MRFVFFKGGVTPDELLLKATVLREITIPAYTRHDGVFVPEHRKMVHVNDEISKDDIRAGRGSHSQREAHRRLSQLPGWNDLPPVHQLSHILSHATGIQNRRSAAAAVSGWRSRARAGQNPTASQWQAFYQLSREQQAAELAQVPDQSRLSAPARENVPQEAPAAPVAQSRTTSFGEDNAGHVLTAGGFRFMFDPLTSEWTWRVPSGAWEPVQNESLIPFLNSGTDASGNPLVPVSDAPVAAQADPAAADLERDRASRAARSEAIRTAGEKFEQIGLVRQGDRPIWTYRQSGEGNDSASVRVQISARDDSALLDFVVTRGGSFNSTLGGNASPDVEIGRFDSGPEARAAVQEEIQRIRRPAPAPAAASDPGVLTFRGVQYKKIGGQWHFSARGREWAVVRDRSMQAALERGDDPNPDDARATPPSVRGAAPQSVRVNDMTMERQADGSWLSRGGVVHGPGSAIWIAAEMLTGRQFGPDEVRPMTQDARLGAVELMARAGRSATEMLDKLMPADDADGVREGDTKMVGGVTYVLRGGRWHRQDQAPAAPAPVAARPAEVLVSLNGDQFRRTADGGWETMGGSPVRNTHYIDSLNRLHERQQAAPSEPRMVLPRRPAAASAPSVTAPPAAPLPEAERAAIRAATSIVQIPDGVSRWSSSATNQQCLRRINQLQEMARVGDLDGVTNFATSRTRSNYAMVDDYRSAILAAAHQAREAFQARSAQSASIPEPPQITGSNPNNTALLAAQRKVAALRSAANAADPVAAILAIPTSRGNGYMNAADDYKARLLSHFGYNHAGQTTREDAHQPAAPAPAPAVRSVTSGARRPAAAPAPAASQPSRPVPAEQDPSIAANPDGKTEAQLGFVPRPNVPLNWTVRVDGVSHPNAGLIPWPDDRMKELARRYLSQPTDKQLKAKEHQGRVAARLAPLHPSFQNVEQRAAQLRAEREARERAERQAREAREAEERRQRMAAIRETSAAFVTRLSSIADVHKPVNRVGNNIGSIGGDLDKAGLAFGVTEDVLRDIVGRLVVDYGNGTRFTANVSSNGTNGVSISFSGNDGTSITRSFSKNADGKWQVDHSFFRAGNRGSGSAKALFRTSIGVYKSLGIEKVTVHANIDVGGYAWAKFGFLCRQNYWDRLRGNFARQLDRMTFSSPAVKERVKAILNDSNPKAMFVLSDFKDGETNIGKKFLLNTDWYGDLNIKDGSDTYRRCVGYIARGND